MQCQSIVFPAAPQDICLLGSEHNYPRATEEFLSWEGWLWAWQGKACLSGREPRASGPWIGVHGLRCTTQYYTISYLCARGCGVVVCGHFSHGFSGGGSSDGGEAKGEGENRPPTIQTRWYSFPFLLRGFR